MRGSELPCLGEQHRAGSALKQVHGAAFPPGRASCEQEVGRKGVSCSKCGLEHGVTRSNQMGKRMQKHVENCKAQAGVVLASASSSLTRGKKTIKSCVICKARAGAFLFCQH